MNLVRVLAFANAGVFEVLINAGSRVFEAMISFPGNPLTTGEIATVNGSNSSAFVGLALKNKSTEVMYTPKAFFTSPFKT